MHKKNSFFLAPFKTINSIKKTENINFLLILQEKRVRFNNIFVYLKFKCMFLKIFLVITIQHIKKKKSNQN